MRDGTLMRDCANFGAVSAVGNPGNTTACGIGGVLGYCNASQMMVETCLNTGVITGLRNIGAICGYNRAGSVMYCCYLRQDGLSGIGLGGGNLYSLEQREILSGRACYLLNRGITDGSQSWYQTIGTDEIVFSGETVYYNETDGRYYNRKDERLKFSQATLLLESDLSLNFYVPESTLSGWTEPYAVFSIENFDDWGYSDGYRTVQVSEYTERTLSDGTPCRVYTFDGITAVEMSSPVTAVLYGTKDGIFCEGKVVNYSVKTYAENLLAKTEDAKLRTLLVDLLNYGAAAQTYFEYHTDTPANKDLTLAQSGYATQSDPLLSSHTQVTDGEGMPVSFAFCTLSLRNRVTVNYYLEITEEGYPIADLELRVRYTDHNGEEQTVVFNTFNEQMYDGKLCYMASLDTLDATQMHNVLSAEVYYSGSQLVSGTMQYSIESYAFAKQNDEDSNLAALVMKMMQYGDSAAAYFEK